MQVKKKTLAGISRKSTKTNKQTFCVGKSHLVYTLYKGFPLALVFVVVLWQVL